MSASTALEVHQFACLKDNYGFLVRDPPTGATASIDVPDADAVLAQLDLKGWSLDLIINTHWHSDHSGGNCRLREATGALVVAPLEVQKVSSVDRVVTPGEKLLLGSSEMMVLDTGGHTLEHVAYYCAASSTIFVGDALFAMGCGRLFEGTAEQMWSSLQRIASLPPETIVYCAHEYTEVNGRFARSVDPDPAVAERARVVAKLREFGFPTVPTTIGDELQTNPFIRAPKLVPHLPAVEAFATLRALKDAFSG